MCGMDGIGWISGPETLGEVKYRECCHGLTDQLTLRPARLELNNILNESTGSADNDGGHSGSSEEFLVGQHQPSGRRSKCAAGLEILQSSEERGATNRGGCSSFFK